MNPLIVDDSSWIALMAGRAQNVPVGNDPAGNPPVFRSSVTVLDPIWIVALLLVVYVATRKG